MIDALVSGSLVNAPQEKISANGKPYVQCRLRIPMSETEALFALATAFDADVCRALLALGTGDAIAAVGALKVGIWTPPDGPPRVNASMVVSAITSPYHVTRKRRVMQSGGEAAGMGRQREPAAALHDDGLDF